MVSSAVFCDLLLSNVLLYCSGWVDRFVGVSMGSLEWGFVHRPPRPLYRPRAGIVRRNVKPFSVRWHGGIMEDNFLISAPFFVYSTYSEKNTGMKRGGTIGGKSKDLSRKKKKKFDHTHSCVIYWRYARTADDAVGCTYQILHRSDNFASRMCRTVR